MPVTFRPRAPRLLLLAAAGAAVLMAGAPAPAVAEESTGTEGPGAGDTVVGELVQAWPEHEDAADAQEHAADGPLSWIETDAGETVRIDTRDVEDIAVGATVEAVLGHPVPEPSPAVELSEPALEVLDAAVLQQPAEAAPAPAGEPVTNRVTVVLATPQGRPRDGTTLQQVVDAVNGPVADFWREQSGGAVEVGVTAAHDWITTSQPDCTDPWRLWSDARAATGFAPGPGRHLLVYVTSTPQDIPGCSYGLAEVGSAPTDGGHLYIRGLRTSLIAHELGHNFGLGHSSGRQCDDTVDTGSCRTVDYRDYYDVMGVSWEQVGSLNLPQAQRIGLLPADQVQAVGASGAAGTYTLSPVSARTGSRAIRLTDPDGVVYWLEYRPAGGRDSWLGTAANWPRLQSGVLLRRSASGSNTSLLLDGTPSPASGWGSDMQAALPVGATVPVAGGRFEVTVRSVSTSAAEVSVTPMTAIATAYAASGGAAGPLGEPTGPETCGLRDGGCRRSYAGGAIYWSSATGARLVTGDLLQAYQRAGAEGGALGYPMAAASATVADGRAQAFQFGSVYSSPATGAHVVRAALLPAWWATGGVSGPLGYPTSDQEEVGAGARVAFQGGAVYWSPATGARVLHGTVLDAYAAAGGATGVLGFPVSDLGPVPGGTAAAFQGGSIYQSAATGAHVVRGGVRAAWWATGGVTGPLGFPVSDHAPVTGGSAAAFQGGSVYESAATGAHAVREPIRSSWWATGGVTGPLGFPTTGLLAVPGGTAQAFAGGSAYSSPASGVQPVSGAIRAAWWATGGVSGPLGFPTSGLLAVPGGSAQAFTGGSVYSSVAGGTRAVRSEFLGPWWATGGVSGPMGFPASDLLTVPGGTAQAFVAGSLYAADGRPAHAVHGPTRASWWSTGGVNGPYGFPVADTATTGDRSATRFAGGLLAGSAAQVVAVTNEVLQAVDRAGGTAVTGLPIAPEGAVPGGRAQAFERASVYWTPSSGPHVVSGPLRSAWWASGGVTGPHGFPVSDVVDVAGATSAGQALAFAGGRMYWSAATGARFVASAVDSAYTGEGGPASDLGWPVSDTYEVAGKLRNEFQGGTLTA